MRVSGDWWTSLPEVSNSAPPAGATRASTCGRATASYAHRKGGSQISSTIVRLDIPRGVRDAPREICSRWPRRTGPDQAEKSLRTLGARRGRPPLARCRDASAPLIVAVAARPRPGRLGTVMRMLVPWFGVDCQWPSVSPRWWPLNSPLVAIISPRWWPSDLPTRGRRFSPAGSFVRAQVRGFTPLPAVAWASR